MASKYESFVKGIEQYTLCYMAKDSGSRWSKPAKVFRIVDDAVEAINGLEARAQGSSINMFTGLKKEIKQEQPDKTNQLLEQVISNQEGFAERLAVLEKK